jgi:hypothetical protein
MDDETFKHLPTVANANSSVGKTQKPDSGPSAPEQVATMVARMLDCFRPSKGVDPQVFATAICGILLRYPMDIIEEITDPVRGLPARQEFMPSPFDVRQMAEKLVAPRYRRQKEEREDREFRAQLAVEAVAQARDPPKKPWLEFKRDLEDEMAGRGLIMPGYRDRQRQGYDLKLRAEMSAKYGKSYDDIPNASDLPDWLR